MTDGSTRPLIAGKYEVLRRLAEGGMGSVYEGRNTGTLKRCALKLLTIPGIEQHPELVQRFLLEARATSVLESDHIVQTFDSGIDNLSGRPYIVMELLRGEDLKAVLVRNAAIEPRAAMKLLLQATTGLAKAHEAGILHRDVKPANLFLTRRDSGHVCVKILDFGIAKVKNENGLLSAEHLTQTGGLLGTPLYMSPEQVRGASNVDARSDVWSLGVVLYECLAGDTPFAERGSVGELMSSILNSLPRHLQDLAPWVPAEFASIAHRALARDPARRFANAGQMRDAIGQLLLGESELREADIVPVSGEDRTRISPRLIPASEAPIEPLRAVTISTPTVRTEIETQQPIALVRLSSDETSTVDSVAQTQLSGSTPSPRAPDPVTNIAERRRGQRAGLIAAALLLGGAGVTLALRPNGDPKPGHAEAAPSSPSISAAAARATEALADDTRGTPPPPPELAFALRVPKQATVLIDGQAASPDDGRVELRGAPGSTRLVEIRRGAKRESARVAITNDGLLPPELEFRDRRSAPAAAAIALPVAAKPADTAAEPAKKPALNENTSEFNPK